jgi:predicted nucleotidyltransferase
VFYRCQVGSKAFGLATDESADDIRGIYLPPAKPHRKERDEAINLMSLLSLGHVS